MKKPKQPIRPDSAPPFQKWAERDFLADTVTMHWEARMFYRTLLQAAFSTASTRPDLPNNDAQLCRLLGGIPAEVWAIHKDEVVSMFTQIGDLLIHRRLRDDFEKLQDYRHSQSESKSKYWDRVRAERLKASKKLATTAQQAGSYQEDVDVEVDSDTENDGEDVEIEKHLLVPSPPFKDSQSKSNARNILSPVAHCLAEIHEETCLGPLPAEGWERVDKIWQAGDYDISKLMELWKTYLAWDCLRPEAPLEEFADGLEEELKAVHSQR